MKLSEIAYQRFRKALFEQKIATGSTLTQNDLVAMLEVQIGPLREALQILASEGLITLLPRSGIRVIKPDMALIKNSFQLRRVVECEAVRRFTETATIEELDRWLARHRELVEEAGNSHQREAELELITRARTLDFTFHDTLITALRNPLIEQVYKRTQDSIELIRLDNMFLFSAVTVVTTMSEHIAVLEAVRLRDRDGATKAMEAHMSASLHRALGF
jgi:DNA-binding GntR family transcriptional regulator